MNNMSEAFVEYFKQHEKERGKFKIGIEVEHFVVDKKTCNTISYYGKDGIEDTLKDILDNDKRWRGMYEGKHLLGLIKNGTTITLEPGAQVEISVKPCANMYELEQEYLNVLGEIERVVKSKGQKVVALGYHPKSKIDQVKFIPKDRYKYMSEYLNKKGKYALNMMKGTASTQVAIDYNSEDDFKMKFRVANMLSPIIHCFFDNTPYFEGEKWNKHAARAVVWENCDNDRSGVVKDTFAKEFRYKDYAEYLLNTPPIIVNKKGDIKFTKGELAKNVIGDEPQSKEELEHILSMVFPDVRLKGYIEIRMADALKYPHNIAYAAFIKGLLYDEENLKELYELSQQITQESIDIAKRDVVEYGDKSKIYGCDSKKLMAKLLSMAKKGLRDEGKYIDSIEKMISVSGR